MIRLVCAALAASVVLAACDGSSELAPADSTTVSDSSGVRIVEHARLESGDAFRAGPPLFRVGDDPGEYEFVRISGGALRADGSSVVSDGATDELLMLNPDGSVRWTAGGLGEGPGEFLSLAAVGWHGDSVLAHDGRNRRVTTIHEGATVRASLLPDQLSLVSARYLGGGVLVTAPGAYSPFTDDPWVQMELLRHELGTELIDTVLVYDYAPGIPSMDATPNPFRPFGRVSAGADRVAYGRPDRAEVRVFDAEGALRQIVRWPHPDREVDDEFWDAYARRRMANPGNRSEQEMASVLADLRGAVDAPLPAFYAVYLDHENRVWLQPYGPDNAAVTELFGFDAEGRSLGWIRLDAPTEILDIGTDRILGVRTDDFGVESVVLIPLIPV